MQARYRVTKMVDGEPVNEHDCLTWMEVEEMKTAINTVRGTAVVENINRGED